MVDRNKAQTRLYECDPTSVHNDEELKDLAALYHSITNFRARLDSYNIDELPDDLDSDTKRQINTALTQLARAEEGVEKTAQERLKDGGGD